MDIVQVYQDYLITRAFESDKHYREGWINTKCPFCTGNPGNHLGYSLEGDYFKCWRCGFHPTEKTLQKLLGISYHEAKILIRKYQGFSRVNHSKKIKVKKNKFMMPPYLIKITESPYAMRYMKEIRKNGFTTSEIKKLQKQFKLRCTEEFSPFDNLDLSYRMIAPLIWDNQVVSWQSRDLTNQSSLRYITCPKKREIIEHKTILYNPPETKKIVVVEGIFDVYKVFLAGFPVTSCFGVEYTRAQLLLLLQYDEIIIFMDPDKAGVHHRKKLMNQILFAGKQCDFVENTYLKDPGDLAIKQIQKLLNPYFK